MSRRHLVIQFTRHFYRRLHYSTWTFCINIDFVVELIINHLFNQVPVNFLHQHRVRQRSCTTVCKPFLHSVSCMFSSFVSSRLRASSGPPRSTFHHLVSGHRRDALLASLSFFTSLRFLHFTSLRFLHFTSLSSTSLHFRSSSVDHCPSRLSLSVDCWNGLGLYFLIIIDSIA